jgi:hypothetical protein
MTSGKKRGTGSGEEVSEEVKLAKLRSGRDRVERDINWTEDKLRELGEHAPPDLVDGLKEAQVKFELFEKYGTDHYLHVVNSFTHTLKKNYWQIGVGVAAGGRKGARRSGWRISEKERQARLDDMREWLRCNKKRERGWNAQFSRDMKNKWGIKKLGTAKQFIYRNIKKLND